jgi:hypothetical protein
MPKFNPGATQFVKVIAPNMPTWGASTCPSRFTAEPATTVFNPNTAPTKLPVPRKDPIIK